YGTPTSGPSNATATEQGWRGAHEPKTHGQSRIRLHRNYAGSPAQGLCLRHLSDGRERGGPCSLLDRAAEPRDHSARSFPRPVPRRLARPVRSDRYTITINHDFDGVLDGCAAPQPGRPRTWINARIRVLYRKLYDRRHCHSIEVYDGDALVGGLYGVSLGRAF